MYIIVDTETHKTHIVGPQVPVSGLSEAVPGRSVLNVNGHIAYSILAENASGARHILTPLSPDHPIAKQLQLGGEALAAVPAGYEAVRIGGCSEGEFYIDWKGGVADAQTDNHQGYIVIEPIEKPKTTEEKYKELRAASQELVDAMGAHGQIEARDAVIKHLAE